MIGVVVVASASTAPEMKSATTASIDTPSPAMKIPAGGTKIGLHAAAVHFSLYRQSGEHFTDRIGADRHQPYPAV